MKLNLTCTSVPESLFPRHTASLFLFMLTMNVIHELCTIIYRLLNLLSRLVSDMNSKPKEDLWDRQTMMGMSVL